MLAVGFGVTVAMWAVGYVARLPAVLLPAPVILVLLVACPFAGGLVVGRLAGLGWGAGAKAGTVTGVLNLLVLGSLLVQPGNQATPSALLWLPGSVLLAAGLAAAGAALGSRRPRRPPYAGWSSAFVHVAVVAALLLLGVGGLVTSTGAGLAVVDWPNSYGYNMFLYPFSRMTGGIYYEHAHRLFGALVGLTTLALAVHLQRDEPRRWVRVLGWIALGMVLFQGLLGGLRVTGRLTLSTAAADMRPSLALAAVHGVFGQVFFALLVALGAFTSPAWSKVPAPLPRASARADRVLGGVLLALILVQLMLGSMQRHFSGLLMPHIAVGVALVAPLAVHVGFRAWGLNPDRLRLQRLGLGLVAAVGVQLLLGLGAFAASGSEGGSATLEVAVTTAHQWFGAVLLGLAVLLQCWTFRLVGPLEA